MKHEHSWHLGQIHHNWQFQRGTPRTAREAFGHSLDSGYRRSDGVVFWAILICFAIGLLLWGCGK